MIAVPKSRHFQLERLADGVYVALAVEGAGMGSNAGIVDLGGVTLVFDACLTPAAAADLRSAAEQLTGRAPAVLVNSHRHLDHVLGNQVFTGIPVIATTQTRSYLAAMLPRFAAEADGQLSEGIRQTEAQLAEAIDPAVRRSLSEELGNNRALLAALPTLALTPPTLTFDQHLTFYGDNRKAEVITYGGGHTDGDAFLYLPAEEILFAGDLALVRNHHWMGHGHPEAWLEILERMLKLPVQRLIPGHGPVGASADMAAARAYIADMVNLIDGLVTSGMPAAQAVATPVPAAYAEWGSRAVFNWNLEALFQKRSAQAQ
jgi:cyclase